MSITSFTVRQKCIASRAEEEMTANGKGGFHYRLFDLVCVAGVFHTIGLFKKKLQKAWIALYNVPQQPKCVFLDRQMKIDAFTNAY